MNALETEPLTYCARHPKVQTVLHCGKCGVPICPRCTIQTPVGARCLTCADLKRLPQFEVGGMLLTRSLGGGLVASLLAWALLNYIPYLRFFLSILVGLTVGEVMSRLAQRRVTLPLEIGAVIVVLIGLLGVEVANYGSLSQFIHELRHNQFLVSSIVLPAVIASFVAVVKLR